MSPSLWIAMGIALGVGVGGMTGKPVLGIAIGVVLAAATGELIRRAQVKRDDASDGHET